MNALIEEARAEVERLEAIDADTGLGAKGLVNLDNARKAEAALAREQKRKDGDARQLLANMLSHYEVVLAAHVAVIEELIESRKQLDNARRAAKAAERVARARGIKVIGSWNAREAELLTTVKWRVISNEIKSLFSSSIL